MELLSNNEIRIERNETFTINKLVKFKNNFPYIVSNKLKNPYIVVSVADTKYQQEKRIVVNKWLSLENVPKFNNTIPINLKSFRNSDGSEKADYNSFDNIKGPYDYTDDEGIVHNGILVHGYINNVHVYCTPEDAVFFSEDEEGNLTFKYWNTTSNCWKNYEFRVIAEFEQQLTRDWTGQSFVYSITLMSGEDVLTYLQTLAEELELDVIGKDKYQLYEELLEKGATFTKYFDIEKPIAIYDVYKPILLPTKLIVSDNVLGGL